MPLTLQGAVAAAEANLPGGGKLTVFSVHGVAENIATGRASPPGFSLTMMQRFITDLTGYLHEMRKRGRRGSGRNITIFGGDFNCSLGWDGKQGYASHGPMFDRLAGFGLRSVLPIRPDNEYTTCIRARIPFRQLDYLFISENARWSNPQIVDSELTRAAEDHLPVVVDLA